MQLPAASTPTFFFFWVMGGRGILFTKMDEALMDPDIPSVRIGKFVAG